jgi:hypothetical protein
MAAINIKFLLQRTKMAVDLLQSSQDVHVCGELLPELLPSFRELPATSTKLLAHRLSLQVRRRNQDKTSESNEDEHEDEDANCFHFFSTRFWDNTTNMICLCRMPHLVYVHACMRICMPRSCAYVSVCLSVCACKCIIHVCVQIVFPDRILKSFATFRLVRTLCIPIRHRIRMAFDLDGVLCRTSSGYSTWPNNLFLLC